MPLADSFGQRRSHSVGVDAVDDRVECGALVARGVRNRVAEILEPFPDEISVWMRGEARIPPSHRRQTLAAAQRARSRLVVMGSSQVIP